MFIKSILLSSIVCLPFLSCGQNNRFHFGKEKAKQAVIDALNDKNYKLFYDTLIMDKETAIAIAEPILYKIYGKKNIIAQRPYECYLIDGYWYICGTLPKTWAGGVFEIIISSKDGKVLRLTHGK